MNFMKSGLGGLKFHEISFQCEISPLPGLLTVNARAPIPATRPIRVHAVEQFSNEIVPSNGQGQRSHGCT